MADPVDEYITKTIKEGDKGSKLLAAKCAPTLKKPLVDIISQGMGGIAVLRPPQDCVIAVHSTGGDNHISDLRRYVGSVVRKMVQDSHRIGATPLGFGNVVDASSMDLSMITIIGDQLRKSAEDFNLPVMNGELADLGTRVNCQANLSGTMISALPRSSHFASIIPGIFEYDGITYAVFDPQGKPVFINCDGIGTKTEFYERLLETYMASALAATALLNYDYDSPYKEIPCGAEDFAAMNLDDTAKLGARAHVLSGVIETKGRLPVRLIKEKLIRITDAFGVLGILQHEAVESRLLGYRSEAPAYNISGSAVSTIDEERLKNLPKPQEGESLIAICGGSNPRSNGISAKRKTMSRLFGERWHETREGRIFLDYLTKPSTILYPVFTNLLQRELATSVFHNSGGAYDGKLARPLAKHNLFVDIKKLFEPDWREVALAAYSLSVKDAYGKYPMGTDGFVSTSRPEEAINTIHAMGFNALNAGKLEKAVDGRTGVKLIAFNGQEVYFSGRD
jgi:phosphoribosylaminoimidazole (AIR) synthetase